MQPNVRDIFEWYFVIFGLKSDIYENGYYMGQLNYTEEYPEVAPTLKFLTESGRFEVNEEIKLELFDAEDRNKLTLRNIMKEIIKLFYFLLCSMFCVLCSMFCHTSTPAMTLVAPGALFTSYRSPGVTVRHIQSAHRSVSVDFFLSKV